MSGRQASALHRTVPAGKPLRLLGWLALGAVATCVLLGVFGLYLQPEFLRTLADQMWACF